MRLQLGITADKTVNNIFGLFCAGMTRIFYSVLHAFNPLIKKEHWTYIHPLSESFTSCLVPEKIAKLWNKVVLNWSYQ